MIVPIITLKMAAVKTMAEEMFFISLEYSWMRGFKISINLSKTVLTSSKIKTTPISKRIIAKSVFSSFKKTAKIKIKIAATL